MSKTIFKLSSVTLALVGSFSVNAAIYNIYGYQPVINGNAKTYGVAIEPGAANCWSGTTCSQTNYKISFEEKLYNEGFAYRDEVPFRYNLGYDLIDNDGSSIYDGFKSYCNSFLGYNDAGCSRWADEQYNQGYAQELNGNVDDSSTYIENSSDQVESGQNNVIVNNFTSAAADAIGTYYGGSLLQRTIAFSGGTALDRDTYNQSKAWAKTSNGTNDIIVGSVSKQSTQNTNDYISSAAIWSTGGGAPVVIPWEGAAEESRRTPQGSARDVAIVNSQTYAVGYNSDADERPVASVFTVDRSGPSVSSRQVVSRFSSNSYLNSLFTAINENGYAIGEAKYATPINSAYANSLFYITDPANPNGSFNEFSGPIFFSGANGKAGAINNNDEAVGAIDYQTHAEVNGDQGKQRGQRAFIAPLNSSNTKAPLNGRAWYLDDLVNDGNPNSTNNQFRVIDATDINDAGVISGTAYYCEGGYDTLYLDSKCNDGSTQGAEKIVAVKLVPIENSTASNIQQRGLEPVSIDRQGGSLGWFALVVIGLLGFRRK